MDAYKEKTRRVMQEVMSRVTVLEGTEYSDVINEVGIELEQGLKELREIVEEKKNEIEVNPKMSVLTLTTAGEKYRICYVTNLVGGQGAHAFGGVGVAWAEKCSHNMGMKICTNEVNRRNGEIWGIIIAAKTAVARKYPRIIVMTEENTYTTRLMRDIRGGKLDEVEGCKVLVEKIKELDGEVEIRIPDEIEVGMIGTSGQKIMLISRKMAKEAYRDAKKQMEKK